MFSSRTLRFGIVGGFILLVMAGLTLLILPLLGIYPVLLGYEFLNRDSPNAIWHLEGIEFADSGAFPASFMRIATSSDATTWTIEGTGSISQESMDFTSGGKVCVYVDPTVIHSEWGEDELEAVSNWIALTGYHTVGERFPEGPYTCQVIEEAPWSE